MSYFYLFIFFQTQNMTVWSLKQSDITLDLIILSAFQDNQNPIQQRR